MELLFMEPVFKEAIWGGTKLRDVFGYEIPSDTTGECWAVSAHKNGDCRIAGGMYDGRLLSSLWEEKPELFGNYCRRAAGSQRIRRGIEIRLRSGARHPRRAENRHVGRHRIAGTACRASNT